MAHQQDNNEEAYNAFVGSWFVNAYLSFDSDAQVVCDNVETKFRIHYDETPDYDQNPWMQMLGDDKVKDPTTKAGRQFRRRFGLPFTLFNSLLQDVKVWFRNKRSDIPLELKLLSSLRVLAKGWTFDGVAEMASIDEETVRVFFHKLMAKIKDKYFNLWIFYPKTWQDAKPMIDTFTHIGAPDCVGSTDCTHIPWGRCPAS